jgi:hypothetical protein
LEFKEVVDWLDSLDSGGVIACAEDIASGRDDSGGIDLSGVVAFFSIFGAGRENGSVDSIVELFLQAPGFGDAFSTADWVAGVAAIISLDVVSLSGLANAVPELLVLAGMLLAGMLLAVMLSLADFAVVWLCATACDD